MRAILSKTKVGNSVNSGIIRIYLSLKDFTTSINLCKLNKKKQFREFKSKKKKTVVFRSIVSYINAIIISILSKY